MTWVEGSNLATEAMKLSQAVAVVLQQRAEQWELIDAKTHAGVSRVFLEWTAADSIYRSIGFEIGIEHGFPWPHVMGGDAQACIRDEHGANIWRDMYMTGQMFEANADRVIFQADELYQIASSWTKQDILDHQVTYVSFA